MKNKIKTLQICLLSSVLLLSVSGCSKFAKVDASKISKQLAERTADLSPVTDLKGKSARVVIRIKQPVGSNRKSKKRLLNKLRQGFNRELGKQSGMVVDRGLSKAVRSEIELAEIYGKKSGRQDADYIMMIALDEYVTHKKAEESRGALGKSKYYSCLVEAEYKGWVRILTIPLLEKSAQWEIEGNTSVSFEEKNSKGCRASSKSRLEILKNKMIENSICSSETDYLNSLAPTGHVLSVKHKKDEVFFETSFGSKVNANKGDTVYFYHELSARPYAEGEVTSVSSKSSWVKLKSMEKKETVYLHDFVRPQYSGMMNTMKCMF